MYKINGKTSKDTNKKNRQYFLNFNSKTNKKKINEILLFVRTRSNEIPKNRRTPNLPVIFLNNNINNNNCGTNVMYLPSKLGETKKQEINDKIRAKNKLLLSALSSDFTGNRIIKLKKMTSDQTPLE